MDFKELRVWRTAMDLAREIYRVTVTFPSHEAYGLTNQFRRAAVSVPSNIAEGSGRRYPREFHRFLGIAEGSLREAETLWILSQDLGYAASSPTLDELFDKSGRMLNRLATVMKASKKLD